MNNHLREAQIRVDRTKRELDAGLRSEIARARKLRNQSDEAFREIEYIIKKDNLDRDLAYGPPPPLL